MNNQTTARDTSTEWPRRKPVTPQDLIAAKVGSKNTIYAAIKKKQIDVFRLGGKIIITPEWVAKNLGW